MNIGELDKRIIIQKKTIGQDADGYQIEEFTDYKPVWASKNNLFGREFFAAAAVNSELTVKFGIRYMKELDSSVNVEGINTTKIFRVKYGNLFYNLTFIDDIKTQHIEMELKALLEVV